MTITGFVFDLDGVITDTAKFHYQAWKEVAQEKLDITITPAVNELLKGRSRMDSLEEIIKFGHQEGQHTLAEKEAIATEKNDRYKQLIQTMTPADILPGMGEFLQELADHHYPMSVASASFNAPFIIKRLKLEDLLGKIVDPASVKHGKPAPDIFEVAADQIDSPYATTVGFEDATAGISGINDAGMFSVGIGDPTILDEADLVFASTADVSLSAIEQAFASKDA
ncbi:beta-phosphoglucomutase [Lacticaseibacillus yichunensis]|uniref:Beta-phosphoglucomutase n=1 Tax=Lacticaseibacillus yichunensis TaxID=2486015 RepID=A0ABW4CQZ0_9LACO|nr:beta-phosphoglucomutase [Lacticaseibacillus yichunensis]